MVRVGTVELQFCLQGHTVGETALQTLVDGVAGRVDIVIEELKDEVVASIRNREILGKHLEETLIFSFFRWSVELEEVLK